ncbi:nuclear transcription factor Y subunit B-5-like [Neltuma alba]|uniref:nuclear transcription factor Y subunit B-5-like n=1 Tax=Neltuma alba TaxID=207710 RepID=UPI0010A50A0F|nr:nuclear transcription factor Y subunit B-5-like [Prosopis alba]XP_028784125.1 nuclear transcription factor Y subunit B-5-like [Prosopis alba]
MEDNLGGSSSSSINVVDRSSNGGIVKEQDRLLPIANVGRIMKQILPQNAKISKEAKETMQECASEFISFVTGEASDKCRKERRKTVNGDDICWALKTLGFDDYAEPLKSYLHRYRELEVDQRANNSNHHHHH